MKTAIVVGASSGIGRELSRILAGDGWRLGLASRNLEALEALARELGPGHEAAALDVRDTEAVPRRLEELAQRLGGEVDLVVLSSGIGIENHKLAWEPEEKTIRTNVLGFAACAAWAGRYFLARGRGHLVALSSVAGHRGSPFNPAYNASKAFVSNYLEGLRLNLGRFPITVTDVRPGYVDTPMTKGQRGMFWVADARTAARQIAKAIGRRKKVVYVTRRWRLVALLMRAAPDPLYRKFSN
ncbi:MAG: SDR family NAD(P)-dependent oxidoreductase [Acidobacteriota bacterium]